MALKSNKLPVQNTHMTIRAYRKCQRDRKLQNKPILWPRLHPLGRLGKASEERIKDAVKGIQAYCNYQRGIILLVPSDQIGQKALQPVEWSEQKDLLIKMDREVAKGPCGRFLLDPSLHCSFCPI